MPFFLLNKKNKKETVLILDIGSGSVAGSIVEFIIGEAPKIIYVKRVPVKLIKSLSGHRFKKEMLKSLGIVLKDLNKNGLTYLEKSPRDNIKKVYCSLASPWFVSETKTVNIKKDKPFLITEKFISDFLAKEEKDFENSNLSKHGSGRSSHSEVIERKLIDIKLNGYKTEEPLGKKVSQFDVSILFSMSQEDILNSIEETVSRYFYIEDFNFNSFTLVSFSAIRDMYKSVKSFLFLDITAEVTDVSLVKNGNILETMSFPLGKNSVIREISKKLKTTPEEAHSSFRLLFSGSLGKTKIDILTKALDKLKENWSKEFQETLIHLSDNISLVPNTVFFTSDDDISSWYGDIIKSEEFIQFSMTENPFTVSFINRLSLGAYVSFRSKAEKDTFIALESVFFNRLFESGE
jgi:hypothetical protein